MYTNALPANNLNMPMDGIVRRLLAWHDPCDRPLPWRTAPAGQRQPYTVWVSEVMAQQTRLETVAGYYQRWISRFPTLPDLAAADQQEVLKVWQGLGYYARARNLHRAARQIMDRHDGRFPSRRAELLALPGIGEYTAGAILSIAFGQPEPVLDGNVRRVLTRLADIDRPVSTRSTEGELWALARAYVSATPPGQAGLANEAIMELGATVCTAIRPACPSCPLGKLCLARARGSQAARPVTMSRKRTPHYDVTAGVIWQGSAYHSPVLIAQRPQQNMLGGLWEFPGGKQEPTDRDLPAGLQREIQEELGIDVQVGDWVATLKHAYSHFRITLHAYHCRHVGGSPVALQCADWRWVDLGGLEAYPFPVTDQKIIAALHSARE